MQLEKIVVGVSETETSRVAGRQAFELAELVGATVYVVTAVADDEVTTIDAGSDTYRFSELDTAQGSAENFVRSLSPSVPWQVVAVDAKAADALVDVAEQVEADLIVVGNVGMQGFSRLFGSVGKDVTHHAPCNVMVVKTV